MQRSPNQKNQIGKDVKNGHFLQSKEWEEFQKSLGRKTFRAGDVLVIKLPLAFGKSYLYSAGAQDLRFSAQGGSASGGKIYDLREIANQENAIFLKYEPMTNPAGSDPAEPPLLRGDPDGLGFVKSKKEVQPQKTIVLDLTKSEGELLSAMRPKTRYNVRVAERRGIKFSIFNFQFSNNFQNSNFQTAETFWSLMQKTADRDKFSTHTREYYEKLLSAPFTKLFLAEYKGKIIAANIILFYGDTAHYLHGASDYEHRNLMAPYLLHWEIIKYAKAEGYKKYDFWGVDEKKWPGVTRFKRGWGGGEVGYIGSYDYIFDKAWYRFYLIHKKLF